jgi:hypothetical protein
MLLLWPIAIYAHAMPMHIGAGAGYGFEEVKIMKKPKYRKLKLNEQIKVGDYVTLDAKFNPNRLAPIDEWCAMGAWVKLTDKACYLVGLLAKDTPYAVARRMAK